MDTISDLSLKGNNVFDPVVDLNTLSSDLGEIDLSMIEKNFHPILKLQSRKEIYQELSNLCRNKACVHPEWLLLAGRIRMRFIQDTSPDTFSEATRLLRSVLDPNYYDYVMENSQFLDSLIDPKKDYTYDIFAVETLLKSYLGRIKKDAKTFIIETPQYMNLRVAVYLWYSFDGDAKEKIKNMYERLSGGFYIQASPTMFNAGMFRPQLGSCFTMVVGDYMQSISKVWHDTAIISMNSGGLGIDFSSLRHSEIGQHGNSKGIVPWIKIVDQILVTVDQCFDPSTMVYTINGPKPISEIIPGDKMIRSNGSVGKVLRPISHEIDKDKNTVFYSIETKYCSGPVIVSEEHPFLSITNQSLGLSIEKIVHGLETGMTVPEYIDVKYLDETSFLAIPIPTYEKDLPRYSLDDCRMYGIFFGACKYKKKSNKAKFSGNFIRDKEFIDFYFSTNNVKAKYNVLYSLISWGADFPFNRTMFYSSGKKHFCPSFLHLPKEKLEMIFLGLFESIGCIVSTKEARLCGITSQQILESIRYILLRLGVSSSCKSSPHSEHPDTLCIPLTSHVCSILRLDKSYGYPVDFFEYDGKLWSRITEKKKVSIESDYVMDLEMERSEEIDEELTANYMTCIGTAHNGGKRSGSGTGYLCVWHLDIEEFLDLRAPTGPESMRARNMFYGLWVSDEFMNRVERNEDWTLFCPNKVKSLDTKWGIEFDMAYKAFEEKARKGKMTHFRIVNARYLWQKILVSSQIETGMPFMLYKDAINRKSNQSNLGTIRLSNLCTEITLYTDKDNIGSCNLGSIALNSCVKKDKDERTFFDFELLEELSKELVDNINRVVDVNYYPPEVPQIKYANLRNRPLGIGVQGLADVFALMDIPWTSPKAREMNKMIFETMYYAAIKESIELAKKEGPYETFQGSHASKGFFQFDLWDKEKILREMDGIPSNENLISDLLEKVRAENDTGRYDWSSLRKDMMLYGLRNSLLIALMPTASSANILGNNECFTGNTLVSLSNGLSKRIDEMKAKDKILGSSLDGIVRDSCTKFIPQGERDTVKLTFLDGRTVTCTPEHKFLLDTGEWKEAQHIEFDTDKVQMGIDPIVDDYDFDEWEWSGEVWSREEALALARIIGYFHADNTDFRNERTTFIAGVTFANIFDLSSMIEDLRIVDKKFRVSNSDGILIVTLGPELSSRIEDAICYGETHNQFNLPSFFLNDSTPKSILREYLSGYFGRVGNHPFSKEKILKKVSLSHYICKEMSESLLSAMKLIGEKLNSLGVRGSHKIKTRSVPRSDYIECILSLEPNSSFSKTIGFRYRIDKSIKVSIASSYWNFVENSIDQRVIQKVLELVETENMSPSDAIEKARDIVFNLEEPLCNYANASGFLLKYKEERKRIGISPEEYFEKLGVWNKKLRVSRNRANITFYLPLISRTLAGKSPVYDISVKRTHAFYANGIAAHNCFEPYTQHVYTRTVLSGQFIIINKHLVKDLQQIGLWTTNNVRKLWANGGSIQNLSEENLDPQVLERLIFLKEKYLTVFELPQKLLLDMSLDRGRYVCQTQSLNCWMANPTYSKLNAFHFYGWKNGAKTGMYYLRQKAKTDPINFSLDSIVIPTKRQKEQKSLFVCNNEEGCLACT